MEYAPIVVFAYNRPHYLKETLIALSHNKEAAQSDLYIYCDGPKANADEKIIASIKKVRALAYEKQWCKNVFVIESEVNKGLSLSVVQGVTETVNKYGKVIVIEDDIVVAPFFLKFMNEALEKYEHEDRVASISGYNFPVDLKNTDIKPTFFSRVTSCWGWATWARAWAFYEPDGNKLLDQVLLGQRNSEFDLNNSYPYLKMLRNTIKGKVDSWGVKWYASCFLSGKLTLYPLNSLVKNIGNIGTHTSGDNTRFFGNNFHDGVINEFEHDITESASATLSWQYHFNKYNRRKINYENLLYAISKIKTKIKF